jgi:O-antigen/teichoic acid export membrane protein
VARNALLLVAGQAATTVLAIVLSAALGRALGPSDFGVFFLVTTMSAFAYVIVEWGQPLLVIRAAAREPLRSGELLGTALVLRAVVAVLVSAPLGLVSWALGYGPRTTAFAVAMVLAQLPAFLAQGYGMAFRAADHMGRDAAVSVAVKAIALALTLPALAIGLGIPGVIAAQAAAGLAALAVAARLHAGLGLSRPRVSRAVAREIVGAGVPILGMTGAAAVQPYLDAIILAQLAPAQAVGWFGAARIVIGTLMAPATILAAASYPALARTAGDPAALRAALRGALRPVLALAALASAGTYLFAEAAIRLIYGAEGFGPAARILQVFAPGFFLLFVDILLGHAIYATGRGNGFAVAKVASVAGAVALDLALVPLFQARHGNGGIGIVVAFAVSEVLVFAGAAWVLRRELEPAAFVDGARALAAAAVTVVAVRSLPALPLAAGLAACVAAFAAASLVVGLASREDLARVAGLVVRRSAPTTLR